MIGLPEILAAPVLVVDDQELNVRLLVRMLRDAGYQSVDSTSDPRAVCGLHRLNHYALILLDLEMPRMDGFEVMKGLQQIETGSYLPVLVLTAEPGHKMRALLAGARDFITKPFDRAEVLMRARGLLEVRLLHLETTRLYDCVVAEQAISERLLLNALPRSIVDQLKARPERDVADPSDVIADSFAEATVLFADIVDFTRLATVMSARGLVAMLNEVFTAFDSISDDRGLEKIKTVGDAYMAVAGLPEPVVDHADRAAHAALDMTLAIDQVNQRSGHHLQVRIGLNTGGGVAGVIGRRKFSYDLWGDTVNLASRMESHGVPGRVQCDDRTHDLLAGAFRFEDRGVIDVKGKGAVHTYFLVEEAPPPVAKA